MDLGELFSNLDLAESTAGDGGENINNRDSRRKVCSGGCERPINVCLCNTIPREPISTFTEMVVLHHPLERRHKLATVPVLSKCLRNCHVVVGRRLRYGKSPLLDSLCDAAGQNPNEQIRAAFLFPGMENMPSMELNKWKSSFNNSNPTHCVLIAFDGTWNHAKEMVRSSLPFLSKFATPVCLPHDAQTDGNNIYSSDLILRKEPFSGCMSTIEAIARSLAVLEPNGTDIESILVDVLKAMVSFQVCFLKPMNPRPKLSKKVKEIANIKA